MPKEWQFSLKLKFAIDNNNFSVQDEPEPWWTAIKSILLGLTGITPVSSNAFFHQFRGKY